MWRVHDCNDGWIAHDCGVSARGDAPWISDSDNHTGDEMTWVVMGGDCTMWFGCKIG